jgi:hypothetical protein
MRLLDTMPGGLLRGLLENFVEGFLSNLLRAGIALAVVMLVVFRAAPLPAQGKGPALPSDADINLVVLQADSAMDQYRDVLDQEESVLGMAGAEAVSRDRQLLGSWDFASKGFKVKPQTFNGELGLEVVLMLDDAARNTALCGAAAAAAVAGRAAWAKSCEDASAHLHSVSQSAAALYREYLEAVQTRAERCP